MARTEGFRDRALVVRTHDFGEADRIIVLLTRDHGLVRGVAKGVRRSKSRFGSRLQPFVELDVQLYQGRSLASITGADTVGYYASAIIEDFARYSCGSAVLEAAGQLADVDAHGDAFLFDAVVDTLKSLQHHPRPTLVLDAFLLSAMEHAGWAPSLFNCAQCGRTGPHSAFHPGAGGAVCLYCRPQGTADVSEEALHMMWLTAHGHLDMVMDEHPELIDQVHRLTTAHLQWHLERRLSSLSILDQA